MSNRTKSLTTAFRKAALSSTALVALAMSPMAVGTSHAVLTDWDGLGVAGVWTDPANWSTGVPGANDTANINDVGAGSPVLAADTTIEILNVTAGGATINAVLNATSAISVDNALTIGGTGSISTGTVNLLGGSTLAVNTSASAAINLQSGTVSGNLSGAAGATKSTAGTVVLSGNNSYSGLTAVDAGILRLTSANAISDTGDVTVASGATLDINTQDETIGTLAGAGDVTLTGGTTLTTGGGAADGTSETTFSGEISESGGVGNLTKTGPGKFVLSGTNLFTGTTTVEAGILEVRNGSALHDSSDVSVEGSGTFKLFEHDETIDILDVDTSGLVDLAGNTLTASTSVGFDAGTIASLPGGVGGEGTLRTMTYVQGAAAAGTTLVTEDVTVEASSFEFDPDAGGVATVDGVLADYDVPTMATLSHTGAGTTNLTGVNTYSGATSVSAGLLYISGSILNSDEVNVTGGTLQTEQDALSDSADVTVNGGTWDLDGTETVANVDLISGEIDIDGNELTTGTFTQSGGVLTDDPTVPTPTGDVTGLFNAAGKFDPDVVDLDGNVTADYSVIAVGGTATVDANGRIVGTTAVAANNVFVQTRKAITTAGAGDGITTSAVNGQTVIHIGQDGTARNVDASSDGGNDAISATTTGTGNILVTGKGDLIGGTGTGKGLEFNLGSGLATSDLEGNISGFHGIHGTSTTGGSFNIMGVGDVTADSAGTGHGIFLSSTMGNGNIVVMQDGNIQGENTGISASTSNGSGTGTGTVDITLTDGTTVRDDTGANAGNGAVVASSDLGKITVTDEAPGATVEGGAFGISAVTQGGDIEITGGGTTTADGAGSTTINADSQDLNGNITVNRTGEISNTGTGDTFGISATTADASAAFGTGTVSVTNTGGVVVGNGNNNGTGIFTSAESGITTITLVSANVSATGDGIRAVSTGETAGANASTAGSGGITVTGDGNVTGDSDGDLTMGQDGIDIMTTAGDILVDVNGAIEGDPGITMTSNMGGDITVNGAGNVTGNLAEGILANSTHGDGNVLINRNGVISGATTGVDARTSDDTTPEGTGTVTVTALMDIRGDDEGAPNGDGAGVITRSDLGLNRVNGAGNISGAQFGIDAQTLGGGDIEITGSGETSSDGAGSTTINAQSTVDDGAVTVNRTGAISNTGTGTTVGINATTVGSGAAAGDGSILVTNTNGITMTNGTVSTGINAAHTGGGTFATVTVNGAGSILNTFATGASNGIVATSDSSGQVSVTSGLIALNTASTGSGIDASSTGGGNVVVSNPDTTFTINGGANGISASSNGSGTVMVTQTGAIGNTTAPDAFGIITNAVDGLTTVTQNAAITSNGVGISSTATGSGGITVGGNGLSTVSALGGDGVFTSAQNGSTNITRNATTEAMSAGADGIDANSTSGTINITVNADANVTGGSAAGDTGIRATSTLAGGAISIDINGNDTDIGSSGAPDDEKAIDIASAAGVMNTVDTEGDINGDITGGDGDETVNNESGGEWFTTNANGGTHTSDLGGGTDIVNNLDGATTSIFDAANASVGDTTIAGLETFNNGGTITMQNGAGNASMDTDRLTLENIAGDTAYNAVAGAPRLQLDTFLSVDGSDSDLLTIGGANVANDGSTSGVTTLAINDTNSGFGGAFAPIGIEVVRVEGDNASTDRSHFVLEGGPVVKGFWEYNLYLDDTRSNPGRGTADVFVMASIPGRAAQELPEIITGAQNLFHQSSDVWVNRQGELRTQLEVDGEANGFWLRGWGSWHSQDRSKSFTLFGETTTYDVGFEQQSHGVMAGVDRTIDNGDGTYTMVGIFGGYLGSDLNFDDSNTAVDYAGGTIGAYATYLNDGLHADVMIKGDIMNADWNAPDMAALAGHMSRSLDTTNIGARIDIGKTYDMGSDGGYVDPFGVFTFVHTSVDGFTNVGTTVDFDDANSARGQLGARFGKRYADDSHEYNAFVTASVVGEFSADNSVDLTSGAMVTVENDNSFVAANIGLGLDFKAKESDWTGFVRLGGEISEDHGAVNGKFGARMKY